LNCDCIAMSCILVCLVIRCDKTEVNLINLQMTQNVKESQQKNRRTSKVMSAAKKGPTPVHLHNLYHFHFIHIKEFTIKSCKLTCHQPSYTVEYSGFTVGVQSTGPLYPLTFNHNILQTRTTHTECLNGTAHAVRKTV